MIALRERMRATCQTFTPQYERGRSPLEVAIKKICRQIDEISHEDYCGRATASDLQELRSELRSLNSIFREYGPGPIRKVG